MPGHYDASGKAPKILRFGPSTCAWVREKWAYPTSSENIGVCTKPAIASLHFCAKIAQAIIHWDHKLYSRQFYLNFYIFFWSFTFNSCWVIVHQGVLFFPSIWRDSKWILEIFIQQDFTCLNVKTESITVPLTLWRKATAEAVCHKLLGRLKFERRPVGYLDLEIELSARGFLAIGRQVVVATLPLDLAEYTLIQRKVAKHVQYWDLGHV